MSAARIAATTLLLLGAWFAIVGRLSWAEFGAGTVVALLATGLLALDRRAADARLRLPPRWWRPLVGLPAAIGQDVWTVTRELASRLLGKESSSGYVAVPVDSGDDQALMVAILGASATPNTVVVGYDPDEHALLIHQLRVSDDPAADVRQRLP